ncbi:hypothetical protein KP509_34G049400 [Ceratopteris richardii]|nr:hypothetical protein KP509_34G049400 [Ceratopteris richardii]
METEMVLVGALSMVEKAADSCSCICETGFSSAVCLALPTQKPSLSFSFSLLEFLLNIAFARFMPKHMEVEMGDAFLPHSEHRVQEPDATIVASIPVDFE